MPFYARKGQCNMATGLFAINFCSQFTMWLHIAHLLWNSYINTEAPKVFPKSWRKQTVYDHIKFDLFRFVCFLTSSEQLSSFFNIRRCQNIERHQYIFLILDWEFKQENSNFRSNWQFVRFTNQTQYMYKIRMLIERNEIKI